MCVTGVLTSLVLFTYLDNGLFHFFKVFLTHLNFFSPFKQRKVKQTIAPVKSQSSRPVPWMQKKCYQLDLVILLLTFHFVKRISALTPPFSAGVPIGSMASYQSITDADELITKSCLSIWHWTDARSDQSELQKKLTVMGKKTDTFQPLSVGFSHD